MPSRTFTCLQPLIFSVNLGAGGSDHAFGAYPGAVGCRNSGIAGDCTEACSAVGATCVLMYLMNNQLI